MAVDRPERISYPYVARPTQRTIFGHPTGLVNLFLTEMWERFSFYGMRAILLLFLVAPPTDGGLGLDPATAAALYTIYNAVVHLLALPGGWIADRLSGTRRAVLIGSVVIAAGHYVLAVPARPTAYVGLIVVALGTGLLRPSISTMVGALYDQVPDRHHAKRDSGFSLFYLGINVGAWSGALVTGWVAQRYGWHVGFAAAAVAMSIAVIQYVLAGRMLGDVGREVHRPLDEYRRAPVLRRIGMSSFVGLVALAAAAALLSEITGSPVLDSLLLLIPPIAVAAPIVFFGTMLRDHTLAPQERSRISAYIPLFLGAALFWLIYSQVGIGLDRFAGPAVGSLNLDVDANAAWYESVNPLLVVLLAPLFAVAWTALGDRTPTTAIKFAVGLLGIGGSCALIAVAGGTGSTAIGPISPLWLLSVYLVQTVAELFLAPVGMSVTTKLAPARFASQMMGLWFVAIALGTVLGGLRCPARRRGPERCLLWTARCRRHARRTALPEIRATDPQAHGGRRLTRWRRVLGPPTGRSGEFREGIGQFTDALCQLCRVRLRGRGRLPGLLRVLSRALDLLAGAVDVLVRRLKVTRGGFGLAAGAISFSLGGLEPYRQILALFLHSVQSPPERLELLLSTLGSRDCLVQRGPRLRYLTTGSLLAGQGLLRRLGVQPALGQRGVSRSGRVGHLTPSGVPIAYRLGMQGLRRRHRTQRTVALRLHRPDPLPRVRSGLLRGARGRLGLGNVGVGEGGRLRDGPACGLCFLGGGLHRAAGLRPYAL